MKTVKIILFSLLTIAAGVVLVLCLHGYLSQPQVPDPVPVHISNIAEIQEQLRDAGYYPGPIDGKWGPQTDRAYCDYQAAEYFKKGM